MITITIPLAPITKKNSQQILINPKTKRPFIMPSKQYLKFRKDCMPFIPLMEPIDYPVNVKCVYYMPTKRECDLTNLMEATHDIMKDYGVIKDDNCKIIKTVNGSEVLYDKENPRTEITIERID